MRLALAAGRLEDPSWQWLNAIGACQGRRRGRTLSWQDGPLDIVVVRGRDIPGLLAARTVDLAILGRDVAEDAETPLWVSDSLGFGRCRLMLAVPDGATDPPTRIATRYPRVTRRWLDATHGTAEVVILNGSVEVAPRLGLADAVVDVVETGETLRANGLRPVGVVLESYAALVTRRGEDHLARRLLDLGARSARHAVRDDDVVAMREGGDRRAAGSA